MKVSLHWGVQVLLALAPLMLTVAGCPQNTQSDSSTASSVPTKQSGVVKTNAPQKLLPGIGTFLAEHEEFGRVLEATDLPNWNEGRRQRVLFKTAGSNRSLLFYLKEGIVVTVYEDGSEKREVVWGEYSTSEMDKPVDRAASDKLPEYTVLMAREAMNHSDKFGDVLIPSYSRSTPASEREATARAIASKEGFTELSLYCTKEARQANLDWAYSEAHPEALRTGFLGSLRKEIFTPGETVFP